MVFFGKTFYGLSVVYFSPAQSAVRNHISQTSRSESGDSKSLNRTQKLSDALVQSITTSGPSVQGIKQLKNSNTYQGFVISSSKGGGITEHTYTLPGNAKWRLTKGIPKNKKGTSVSIKYLGIKDGQLMFEYIDFQNKPKVFQKSEKIQKEVIYKPARNGPTQVGSVRLDIISITGTTLTYRIFAKL